MTKSDAYILERFAQWRSDFHSVQFEIVAQLWLTQFGGVERHRREIQQIRYRVFADVLEGKSQLMRSSLLKIGASGAVGLFWDQPQRTARIADH